MTVRLQGFLNRLRHADRSDDAVSPVVGMILVLAISIVGISAILYWGLPAIDEMKVNVEYRSITTQFSELDGTIKELVAGTTEKTAKRWQPALNRGSVNVMNNTEGWLVSAEPYNASVPNHDFVWLNVADGDALLSIATTGTAPAFNAWKIEAYIVTGTTTLTTLNVTLNPPPGTGNAQDDQMGLQSATWTAGTTQNFKLWVKDAGTPTAQNLVGGTFKFRIYTGAVLVAEAWYVNTGRVDYQLTGPVTTKTLVENNGAIIAGGTGSTSAIVNSPSMPPPSTTGGTYRFFGRLIAMGGNASFAGDNRFDLLISLYSTATLGSYDCALASNADCVESTKVFVYGTQQAPWHTYLTNAGKGYRFTQMSFGGQNYLEERETKMGFTLLGSTVTLVGS